MHRFSPPPLIQFRLRQRIACCGNQVIVWWNRSAISGAMQSMKHHTQPEPSTTVFSGTSNFECLSCHAYLANLSAPRAGEINHATESGAELEGSGNAVHN